MGESVRCTQLVTVSEWRTCNTIHKHQQVLAASIVIDPFTEFFVDGTALFGMVVLL